MKHSAPWHKASWDHFLDQSLPELIDGIVPLSSYERLLKAYDCTLKMSIALSDKADQIIIRNIPIPDEGGIFHFEDDPCLVVPLVSSSSLKTATVSCAGDLALNYVSDRLASLSFPKNRAASADAFGEMIGDFIRAFLSENVQLLDTHNWFCLQCHPRRIIIESVEEIAPEDNWGYVCPVETPEGPTNGKVYTLARGAVIRERKIYPASPDDPSDLFSNTAAMIPFMEYSHPEKIIVAVNRMRSWIKPLQPEPAWVRSGNEPDDDLSFWCGYNFLTAYTAFGWETFGEGMVMSESALKRMVYEDPVALGDIFSNRHGHQCVLSAVLPDNKMPKLKDGTIVEVVVNFMGLHTHRNTGQLLEALAGRAVEKSGEASITILPFKKDGLNAWKTRGLDNGADFKGQEKLRLPNQKKTTLPVTSGWVYWGRSALSYRGKMSFDDQKLREPDYLFLREIKADELTGEILLTEPDENEEKIVPVSSSGTHPPFHPFTTYFKRLSHKATFAGFTLHLDKEGLHILNDISGSDHLKLAEPFSHPYLPGKKIDSIHENPNHKVWKKIVKLNDQLKTLNASKAPKSLIEKSRTRLKAMLREYFYSLLSSKDFSLKFKLARSGSARVIPSGNHPLDCVGIPEEMAFHLYQDRLLKEMDPLEVNARSGKAIDRLDQILKDSAVILKRYFGMTHAEMMAFRPVRIPHHTVEIHPLYHSFLELDFHGEVVVIFVPKSKKAVKEALRLLSLKGHLKREISCIEHLIPRWEAMWGLAWLSLDEKGRSRIFEILGQKIVLPEGFITRKVLLKAFRWIYTQKGIDSLVNTAEMLFRLGLETTSQKGPSLPPFPLSMKERISDEAAYEMLAAESDFSKHPFGPQLLAIKSDAKGSLRNLFELLKASEGMMRLSGGFLMGLSPDDFFDHSRLARVRNDEWMKQWYAYKYAQNIQTRLPGYTLLKRLIRSEYPGYVLARAAESGEIDPLLDEESRRLVGG